MSKETIENKISPEMIEKIKKTAEPELLPGVPGTTPVDSERKAFRDKKIRYKNSNTVEEALEHYPVHIVKLVNLVKSNSDIRRYTSLGILNYLYQKGVINTPDGWVGFKKWTKFSVEVNGLLTEYRYSEPFFINCLIASFTSFANAAQKIIKVYCSKEYNEPFAQDNDVINEAVNACNSSDNTEEEE